MQHNSADDQRHERKRANQQSGEADFSQLVQNVSSSIVNLARDLPELLHAIEKKGGGKGELVKALKPLQRATTDICGLDEEQIESLMQRGAHLFRSHPCHGVFIGADAPHVVRVFIEIVSTDTLKYEVDKPSGNLKADRPQLFSNVCPASYGFIPQTYCGDRVGQLCGQRTRRKNIVGDGDPLDICVLASHNIPHGDFILEAIPVGGFRMIDKGQADDKIIAVLKGDPAYGHFTDLKAVPKEIIKKLEHYFLTYKDMPGTAGKRRCEITHIYGKKDAHAVIRSSQEDYLDEYGHVHGKK